MAECCGTNKCQHPIQSTPHQAQYFVLTEHFCPIPNHGIYHNIVKIKLIEFNKNNKRTDDVYLSIELAGHTKCKFQIKLHLMLLQLP